MMRQSINSSYLVVRVECKKYHVVPLPLRCDVKIGMIQIICTPKRLHVSTHTHTYTYIIYIEEPCLFWFSLVFYRHLLLVAPHFIFHFNLLDFTSFF
jgi:hypothetical protein